MKQKPIKEIKNLLKHIKELNKCLSELEDEDINRLFCTYSDVVKEIKNHFLDTEIILAGTLERNHWK